LAGLAGAAALRQVLYDFKTPNRLNLWNVRLAYWPVVFSPVKIDRTGDFVDIRESVVGEVEILFAKAHAREAYSGHRFESTPSGFSSAIRI
jgi:hypothetical protein